MKFHFVLVAIAALALSVASCNKNELLQAAQNAIPSNPNADVLEKRIAFDTQLSDKEKEIISKTRQKPSNVNLKKVADIVKTHRNELVTLLDTVTFEHIWGEGYDPSSNGEDYEDYDDDDYSCGLDSLDMEGYSGSCDNDSTDMDDDYGYDDDDDSYTTMSEDELLDLMFCDFLLVDPAAAGQNI